MKTDVKNENVKAPDQGDDRLSWRYQDKEYNESFKEWRKMKQNSIGFYFVEKPNQLTYQDKVGFIHDYPEAREANVFQRVITGLGLILMYRVIYDIFTMYFLPLILEFMGFNIHYTFFSGQRTGNETLLITYDLIVQTAGRLIPIAILVKHIQMPISVMLPTKIHNKPMFRFGVPAIILVTALCSFMLFFYEGLLSVLHITSVRAIMLPKSVGNIIYLIIVQIIIIPIASELSIHGVILQFTRQFGDGTALIITSLILTFVTYDITLLPFTFIISVVIGYFTIRTGSVKTAIVMRIAQRAYVYALYFIDHLIDESYNQTVIALFFFLTMVFGLAASVRFFCNHSDKFSLNLKERYMSVSSKILTAVTTIPLIAWFTLSFVVTVLNLNFKF